MVRLLDLFCGAGGCSVGYARAGFEVVGVDIEPHPDYPFEFHQADAMTYPLDGFDAIHASPPCQGETSLKALHDRDYEQLLIPTLERFAGLQVPWIVENVNNATAPATVYKVRLCGSSFGLQVRRHRWFWSNVMLLVPGCDHPTQGQPLGVYGHGGTCATQKGRQATRAEAPEAMGIDWMTHHADIVQAIPPAYTEHIGAHLMAHLGATA